MYKGKNCFFPLKLRIIDGKDAFFIVSMHCLISFYATSAVMEYPKFLTVYERFDYRDAMRRYSFLFAPIIRQ